MKSLKIIGTSTRRIAMSFSKVVGRKPVESTQLQQQILGRNLAPAGRVGDAVRSRQYEVPVHDATTTCILEPGAIHTTLVQGHVPRPVTRTRRVASLHQSFPLGKPLTALMIVEILRQEIILRQPNPRADREKHSAKELTACCGTEYTSRSAKLSSRVALGNRSVTKLRNAIERLSMQLLITGAIWSVLWSSCSCSWLLLGWLSIGVSLYTFSMCFSLISSV
uniref:Uncharacterized protein n=1 Tax=Anopheles atroparvus TaxID=41427 RepID=A0A182J5B8_ANOAO